jgi:hypothetical protein
MFGICQNLDKEFDIELYNRICSDTDFHKLTWKKKFADTVNGEETFYGHIVSPEKDKTGL